MKMDLVGLGSAIIDFSPSDLGVPLNEVRSFVPYAGGAVSNILVASSRLGLKTGFIGCIGDDEFGSLILRDFKQENVDTSCVKRTRERLTGIAIYSVNRKGERRYVFYRFPGYADPETLLRPEDIKDEYIAQSKMLHFSEALLRNSQTRNTVFRALKTAKQNDVQVSCDPNMRADLWTDFGDLRRTNKKALCFTEIYIATLREASFVTGKKSAKDIAQKIARWGPSIVVIREKENYHVTTQKKRFRLPIFKVKAVDTAGAGDAFDAGFLTGLIKGWDLQEAVLLGNSVAALKVMKVGTRTGLPRLSEARKFLDERVKANLLVSL